VVSNAILHNDQCVLTLHLVPAGSDWQIAVADTGRGIDPLEQEKIFEEFYQLENLERDRSKGLGLGLSIVRRLSDLLDIKMEFESEPGKGTQFSFTIAASAQEEIEESTVDFTHESLESLVILVVDDELSVREGMRAILERLGCTVATADSSDAAMAAATTEKPDIALVDFRLREHDSGLLAIDRLRHLYPELPAIIISGETAPDRLVEVSRTNIPVLAKPVLIGPLKEAILRNCFPRSESSQNVAE
jgi:CheY-like chemotaxis protein